LKWRESATGAVKRSSPYNAEKKKAKRAFFWRKRGVYKCKSSSRGDTLPKSLLWSGEGGHRMKREKESMRKKKVAIKKEKNESR